MLRSRRKTLRAAADGHNLTTSGKLDSRGNVLRASLGLEGKAKMEL